MGQDIVSTAHDRWVESTKLLLSPDETCNAIGVGRATLFKLLASGEIPSIKIGRLRRIPVRELRQYVERQVAAQTSEEGQMLLHGEV